MKVPRRWQPVGLAILTACGQQMPAVPAPAQSVTADGIAAHVAALAAIATAHDGTRAAGTDGYEASVDYAAEELAALGLEVERQDFGYPFFEQTAPVTVAIAGGDALEGDDVAKSMLYGGTGTASGPLVEVADGCVDDAFADVPARAIVVVPSGECFRREQVIAAQEGGAAAFIGAYPAWPRGQIGRPTLIAPEGIDIPAVAVGADVVRALEDAQSDDLQGPPTVAVGVATRTEEGTSTNVVATLGDASSEILVVGAHLDSVMDGPGINDNASGVAAVLEVAEVLASAGAGPREIQFALWGAEELGSHGSRAFLESLAGDVEVTAYINLDMLGSTNGGRYVYAEEQAPPGSERIGESLARGLDREGLSWMPIDIGGRSDHGPFMAAGFPAGGLFSGASEPLSEGDADAFGGEAGELMDPCYHLPCDDDGNVDTGLVAELARAAAFALEDLGDE